MQKLIAIFSAVILFQSLAWSAGPKSSDVDITSEEAVLTKEMAPTAAGENTESTAVTPTDFDIKTAAGPMVAVTKDPDDDTSIPNAERPSTKKVKENLEKLAESQIPVFTASKATKSTSTVSTGRMMMGLGVIFIMSLGLIYFSRWYAKRNQKSTDQNKIRLISQHFLGPRKSIAIVRVAGESMLIGITDQNISMLKPLSMLEEEEADTGISSFKNTLMNSNHQIEEDFVTQSVVDRVSKTIKGMRSL